MWKDIPFNLGKCNKVVPLDVEISLSLTFSEITVDENFSQKLFSMPVVQGKRRREGKSSSSADPRPQTRSLSVLRVFSGSHLESQVSLWSFE